MAAIQTIYWPVPEGFPAMSLPVNPATRFKDDDIVLSPATESDLMHIADGLYKGFFPKSWWDYFEPPTLQPSAEVRKIRLTERFKPLLTQDQNFRFIVAKIAGEFAGCAGWHIPGKEWRGSMMLCDVPKNKVEAGWNSGQSVDAEIWSNVDVEKWAETWKRFEDIRREIMGEEPHWYLQPLIVLEKFRGRGIGRKLLDYAIERADAEGLPSTIYLEAFPNARPVYLHVGFKPVEGQENALVFRGSLRK